MSQTIAPWVELFPAEAAYVGAILTGYGEVEFAMCLCVGAALRDEDLAIRLLFRVRGESQRIDMADTIIAPTVKADPKLSGLFANTIGAVRSCRKMRNLYAHCHWDWAGSELACVNLEEVALADDNSAVINQRQIPLQLLADQESYMSLTHETLRYLYHEMRRAQGIGSHGIAKPRSLPRAPLGNR